MQTARLVAWQRPSRTQHLLDSLLQRRDLMPTRGHRIIEHSDLPSALQKIVFQSQREGRVWTAWTDQHRTWLFNAEMSLDSARERGQPALQVGVYREDGRIRDSRLWTCLNDGTWQPCTM
ncbi:MAG TPA: hypothetical protein VGN07_18215 [Steroidobacteraceae bacterium]|jgi:hypothetical protein